MIKERRDNKGRLLLQNECQLSNGSYTYRYTDIDGIRKSITNWRLLPEDIAPERYYKTECLRETENRIIQAQKKHIKIPVVRQVSLNDYWEKYISLKCEISENTLVSYIYLYNKHIKQIFGKRPIESIKYSDVKRFYIDKIKEGLGLSSIKNLHRLISPIFELAVREGYIDKNPCDGLAVEFSRRKDWHSEPRKALTEKEQEALVNFLAGSYKYKEYFQMVTVFLGTGLRAGELTGLCWEDVNFEENVISVNHTLNYKATLSGTTEFFITFPKSNDGVREIPMLKEVRETLQEMYERRNDFNPINPIVIDGYSNFVFRDLYGCVYTNRRINEALKRIISEHNAEEKEKAEKEGRNPIMLPDFTCHHLRHTFCTRLCLNGCNIKSVQSIMGHAHAETTLRIYANICDNADKEEMQAMEGKIKLK